MSKRAWSNSRRFLYNKYKRIEKNNKEKSPIIVVGNKCDLEDKRQVTYEEGKELADKNELLFFESSAKDGINVDDIFINSAKEISKKIEQGYYDLESDSCGIKKGINRNSSQEIHLGNDQQNNINSGGCC